MGILANAKAWMFARTATRLADDAASGRLQRPESFIIKELSQQWGDMLLRAGRIGASPLEHELACDLFLMRELPAFLTRYPELYSLGPQRLLLLSMAALIHSGHATRGQLQTMALWQFETSS